MLNTPSPKRRPPIWSPRTRASFSPTAAEARKKLLYTEPPPAFGLGPTPTRVQQRFVHLTAQRQAQRQAAATAFAASLEAVPEDVREAFDYHDRNHSGFLDYLELQDALRAYGMEMTIDEAAEFLRQYDTTGDGRLNLVRADAIAARAEPVHRCRDNILLAPRITYLYHSIN